MIDTNSSNKSNTTNITIVNETNSEVIILTAFNEHPYLVYVIPGVFLFAILFLALLGCMVRILDINTPKRYYNKLTFQENIQKHSTIRLIGCFILLFNPFFNYLIKGNFYLGRGLRLILICNYFLAISAISLIVFLIFEEKLLIDWVFYLSGILWVAVVIFRPLLL